ncbi:HET-domain-containing protein [Hyaloscypha hepaticicola]|uniref:HET-domain-containing protein n=1 Tax=Hyaloscypha hepaticicola TaxID=2082293 RepID=A0A2J6Q296_9HELO|nr:HET-domain-containing protein [Hyaloscypha hepaticicola]
MRRLKDNVFTERVEVNSNDDSLAGSQQSPGSDYLLPDSRLLRASLELDDTEDVVVVPKNEWTCRTCLWKADPTIFTLHGSYSPQYFIHVEEAAIRGCPRCKIVVQYVNTLGIKRENNIIEFIKGPYRDPDWFRIQEDPHPPFQIFRSAYDGRARRNAAVLPMNPLGKSMSSTESLNWAAYRLRRCLQSHSDCTVTKESFRPTRLINVNSVHPDVILEDEATLPAVAKYVALSHCWGKRPITCRTTKSNYLAATTGVPLKSLPQSFQDAIIVTRALGLDYLWIDSISIIQDDEHDWNKESSKMFEVYNGAQVTLAAVHASDSSEGLFVEHSQFQVRLDDLQFSGDRSSIYTRRIHHSFHSWQPKDLPNQSPLFDRAWAYQERLVSPRTLYFTEREILWECLKETACECKEDDVATSPKQQYQLALGKSGGALQWHHILSEFSRLDLTVESDRFPAISAIARSTAQRGILGWSLV